MSLAHRLVAMFLLTSSLVHASPAAAQYTGAVIHSQPGDAVGSGGSYAFTADSFAMGRNYMNGVTITIIGTGWAFDFSGPWKAPLSVGTYPFAVMLGSHLAGLRVSREGTWCNDVTGRFIVREIAYTPGGAVTRFAADVEQHCNDANPGLFASVRVNSTIPVSQPFGGAFPRYGISIIPPHHGKVVGIGLACGTGATDCSVDHPGPLTAILTAIPDPGYIFTGWTGACNGGTTTTLHVNMPEECGATFGPAVPSVPRHLLQLDGPPDEYISDGRTHVLSDRNSVWSARVLGDFNGVVIDVFGAYDTWHSSYSLAFQASDGEILTPGVYSNAARAYFRTTTPGLGVSANHNGCNEVAGSFVVHELTYKPGTKEVSSFAADFVQYCGNMLAPPLIGTIRFNSTVVKGHPLCATRDPYAAVGGGTCANGEWLPPGSSLPDAGTTAIFLHSEPGDWVGGGSIRTLTPPNFTFRAATNDENGITVVAIREYEEWRITLAANGGTLRPGDYLSAISGSTFTSVRVSGDGRGCAATGRFRVLELEYAVDGSVLRFAADVEQHCNDFAPGLFAAVRYRSTIASTLPFEGNYPRYELRIARPTGGVVTGGGLACGGAATACDGEFEIPTTVVLDAMADPGFVFAGWTGACNGAPETAMIDVNSVKECSATFLPVVPTSPRTLLVWDSSPGDYIGQGEDHVYSGKNAVWKVAQGVDRRFLWIDIDSTDGVSFSRWRLAFEAPLGTVLAPGSYPNAARFASPTAAGLSVSGNGRGCSPDAASFVVHELTFNPVTGLIRGFAADFVHRCQGSEAPLTGSLKYRSELGMVPCATPDPYEALGGGMCYDGSWIPPDVPPPGDRSPTPTYLGPPPPPPTPPLIDCAGADPYGALGGGTCYNGSWVPPGVPDDGTSLPPPLEPPPYVPPSSCTTPDPFVALGGGTCYNGGWLPPGMPIPNGPTVTPPPTEPPPTTPPPSVPPPPTSCTTPDPFAALGGGTCYNGGWLPPGMPIPNGGTVTPPPTEPPPTTPPPSVPPPPTSCTTPDPFAALGGGTCYNGGWLPPGMPIPGGGTAPQPASAPPSPTAPTGCTTPDPFVVLGGGTCYKGNWLPPGMPIPGGGG